MKKRGQFEIMACILTEAQEPAKKTRLMYRCNMAWSTFSKYLPFLLEKELLAVNSERYRTTRKGREWLDAFAEIKRIMGK